MGVSGGLSVCLFSVGARSAAGSGGTSAVGDFAGDVGGVVVGEGEKSGCEGGGGEPAGEVGVGPPVVAWRRVVCPVDAAGLLVLSIGPDIARRRSQLVERQKSNLDGVWDCF